MPFAGRPETNAGARARVDCCSSVASGAASLSIPLRRVSICCRRVRASRVSSSWALAILPFADATSVLNSVHRSRDVIHSTGSLTSMRLPIKSTRAAPRSRTLFQLRDLPPVLLIGISSGCEVLVAGGQRTYNSELLRKFNDVIVVCMYCLLAYYETVIVHSSDTLVYRSVKVTP
jgi:hypothetical protein